MPTTTSRKLLDSTIISLWDSENPFRQRISEDIESLSRNGPINSVTHGDVHRLLSKVFPFGIFHRSRSSWLEIIAILDLPRNPAWIRQKLSRIR